MALDGVGVGVGQPERERAGVARGDRLRARFGRDQCRERRSQVYESFFFELFLGFAGQLRAGFFCFLGFACLLGVRRFFGPLCFFGFFDLLCFRFFLFPFFLPFLCVPFLF